MKYNNLKIRNMIWHIKLCQINMMSNFEGNPDKYWDASHIYFKILKIWDGTPMYNTIRYIYFKIAKAKMLKSWKGHMAFNKFWEIVYRSKS